MISNSTSPSASPSAAPEPEPELKPGIYICKELILPPDSGGKIKIGDAVNIKKIKRKRKRHYPSGSFYYYYSYNVDLIHPDKPNEPIFTDVNWRLVNKYFKFFC